MIESSSGNLGIALAVICASRGYELTVVTDPNASRAAILAMQRVLATIARDGSTGAMIDDMASFKEREAVVDTAGWLARDRRYSA